MNFYQQMSEHTVQDMIIDIGISNYFIQYENIETLQFYSVIFLKWDFICVHVHILSAGVEWCDGRDNIDKVTTLLSH